MQNDQTRLLLNNAFLEKFITTSTIRIEPTNDSSKAEAEINNNVLKDEGKKINYNNLHIDTGRASIRPENNKIGKIKSLSMIPDSRPVNLISNIYNYKITLNNNSNIRGSGSPIMKLDNILNKKNFKVKEDLKKIKEKIIKKTSLTPQNKGIENKIKLNLFKPKQSAVIKKFVMIDRISEMNLTESRSKPHQSSELIRSSNKKDEIKIINIENLVKPTFKILKNVKKNTAKEILIKENIKSLPIQSPKNNTLTQNFIKKHKSLNIFSHNNGKLTKQKQTSTQKTIEQKRNKTTNKKSLIHSSDDLLHLYSKNNQISESNLIYLFFKI